jgi:hypothetical protein
MGSSSPSLGNHSHAGVSSSTVGSGQRWTGDSSDIAAAWAENEYGTREKDDPRGPLGWIKNKYREAKENADKRAKSPPEQGHGVLPTRRSVDERRPAVGPPPIQESDESIPLPPQELPLPNSPSTVQKTHNEKTPNH